MFYLITCVHTHIKHAKLQILTHLRGQIITQISKRGRKPQKSHKQIYVQNVCYPTKFSSIKFHNIAGHSLFVKYPLKLSTLLAHYLKHHPR